MTDPILEGLDFIYKDVLEHGMRTDGRWTIGSHEFMWMDSAIRHTRKVLSLANTVLSYIAVLHGNEIIIPNYLIESGIGTHTINVTIEFLPIEEGENVGDWKIKIKVLDISEEGEIIED